jgi:hypothetical protein
MNCLSSATKYWAGWHAWDSAGSRAMDPRFGES